MHRLSIMLRYTMNIINCLNNYCNRTQEANKKFPNICYVSVLEEFNK